MTLCFPGPTSRDSQLYVWQIMECYGAAKSWLFVACLALFTRRAGTSLLEASEHVAEALMFDVWVDFGLGWFERITHAEQISLTTCRIY